MNSETSVCRERLEQFCRGDGLDLGCGGDLITPHAIGVDLAAPYTQVGSSPIHLSGDARHLHWFTDACLDFVFSSHLLEDFAPEWTMAILLEWQRVIKPGGYLVIYGPDEPTYRAHCEKTGQHHNKAHSVPTFGANYVVDLFKLMPWMKIVHRLDHCDTYGFDVVAEKGVR